MMNQQPKLPLRRERDIPRADSAPERVVEDPEISWEAVARFAIIGMGFIAAVGALYFARSIIMPVLAALIVGLTLSPIPKFAARYRIPHAVTALMLVAAFGAALYPAVNLLSGPAMDLVSRGPELGGLIKEKLRWLDRPIAAVQDLQKSVAETASGPSTPKVAVETSVPSIIQSAVGILTPALSEFIVFFGTLLFFLIGFERMRVQLIRRFETREARRRVLRIWNNVEQDLITYLGTVTAINFGLGVVTAAMLYAIGFPNPLAFGALAFVLNYVPYLGPAALVMGLFAVGIIALPTLGQALLAPALFVAIATVEGHFITPGIVGRRLTLSPFLVFLALAFWTWLWGPLGTFMATPLLIITVVVLGHLFPAEDTPIPK
jgi:predicted PurR-regulated permease PerM